MDGLKFTTETLTEIKMLVAALENARSAIGLAELSLEQILRCVEQPSGEVGPCEHTRTTKIGTMGTSDDRLCADCGAIIPGVPGAESKQEG